MIQLDPEGLSLACDGQTMALTRTELQVLAVLGDAQRQRMPRVDLAYASSMSTRQAHAVIVNLRNKAGRLGIPLRLTSNRDGYLLDADVRVVRRRRVNVELDSLRLILRLISSCTDPQLAETARRHFLG